MTDDRKNANGSKEDRSERKLKLYQKIVSDIRFTIPLLITLFSGTIYGNADAIKKLWTPPIAEGETSASAVALQQSLDSFDAAIKKIKEEQKLMQEQIKASEARTAKASTDADRKQNARLSKIEELVQ